MIGDAQVAVDRVRSQGGRVEVSDVDLLCDFDRVVDLDAKAANGALDLGVPE